MRRMLFKAATQCIRSVLLCPKGSVAPYSTTLRFKRACKLQFLSWKWRHIIMMNTTNDN